jgi:hypothetical protein
VSNYEDRLNELQDSRTECDQARMTAFDNYTIETNRIACEEHSITRDFFYNYILGEQLFYKNIQGFLSEQIPNIQQRLNEDQFTPSFHCDLAEHCSKNRKSNLAYPIKTCVRLLKDSVREEGLFRVQAAQGKQKRFVTELDLKLFDKYSKLEQIGYDAHVVASALKQYLRELPDCLLTNALLPQWNEIPSL